MLFITRFPLCSLVFDCELYLLPTHPLALLPMCIGLWRLGRWHGCEAPGELYDQRTDDVSVCLLIQEPLQFADHTTLLALDKCSLCLASVFTESPAANYRSPVDNPQKGVQAFHPHMYCFGCSEWGYAYGKEQCPGLYRNSRGLRGWITSACWPLVKGSRRSNAVSCSRPAGGRRELCALEGQQKPLTEGYTNERRRWNVM